MKTCIFSANTSYIINPSRLRSLMFFHMSEIPITSPFLELFAPHMLAVTIIKVNSDLQLLFFTDIASVSLSANDRPLRWIL